MLEMPQLMSFTQKLQQKRAILVPGAPNELAARVITGLGFEAIYVAGAGMTNMSLGLPDLSFVDLTQISQHTMAIRRRSRRPTTVTRLDPLTQSRTQPQGSFLPTPSRTIRW
jgi:2-methylisocitrate lyase-like PEP mutase family enzyme